jgi:hypothetical protein
VLVITEFPHSLDVDPDDPSSIMVGPEGRAISGVRDIALFWTTISVKVGAWRLGAVRVKRQRELDMVFAFKEVNAGGASPIRKVF